MPLKSSSKDKAETSPSPQNSTPIEVPFELTTVAAELLSGGGDPLKSNLRMLHIPGNSSLVGTASKKDGKTFFTVIAATFHEESTSCMLLPLDNVTLPVTGEPPKLDLNNPALINAWKKGEAAVDKARRDSQQKQKKKSASMDVPLHMAGLSSTFFAGDTLEYIELTNPKDKKDIQTYLGHLVNKRLVDIEGAMFTEKTKDGDMIGVASMFDHTVTLNIDGRSEVYYDMHDGKVDRNDPALKAAFEKAKSAITEDMRQGAYEKFLAQMPLPTMRPDEAGIQTTLFPSADVSAIDLSELVPKQADSKPITSATRKR